MMESRTRWSDDKLEEFYNEFHEHDRKEQDRQSRYDQLHNAVFQLEDTNRNIPPGLLQMTARIGTQLEELKLAQDRRKIYITAAASTVIMVWLFITDVGRKLVEILKG